jgi:hypothetical protein
MKNLKELDLQALKDKWPSAVVTRDKVEEFTGGMLTRGTMANLDCRGEGPPRFYWSERKIVYPVDKFIEWLAKRMENCRPPVPVKERRGSGQYKKTRKATQ